MSDSTNFRDPSAHTSPVHLECTRCGRTYRLSNLLNCPACAGILLVSYAEGYTSRPLSVDRSIETSMWRFSAFLPPVQLENVVSLGEGMTPLRMSKKRGPTVFFKDESKNPTGSFKDRPTSLCISMAKEFGCTKVVTASSGNGAAAAACYARMAGLDNTIFVPERTPMAKVAQTISYGGNVVKVRGNFSRSFAMAKRAAEDPAVMNVTTTFLNPYGVEGDKTIAYEIASDLGTSPAVVFIPVGAGPIAYGIWKGFLELCALNAQLSMPRIIAVQAEGCAPIARALQLSRPVVSEPDPVTIASAISDPLDGYEQDGDLAVSAVRSSNGFGITVTDKQIIEAGLGLARDEGLFVEPASAAAYAGYVKALHEGLVDPSALVVCLLTGHGLKDSTAYIDTHQIIPVMDDLFPSDGQRSQGC